MEIKSSRLCSNYIYVLSLKNCVLSSALSALSPLRQRKTAILIPLSSKNKKICDARMQDTLKGVKLRF